MIFTELILQNFGPYAGRHLINLAPQNTDNDAPIILFGGMNGGGKTTLMDALRLVLYGARAGCSGRNNLSYGDFLNQCVYKGVNLVEQTRIELAFQHIVDDGWKEYRIVRYWQRREGDNRDTLGILDENWPDPELTNIWDEYIETLLPLAISNLFLFDGEQVRDLAEQDTPSPSLGGAIKSLLGLELVEKLDLDLDVIVGQKRRTIADASQLSTMMAIERQLSDYIEECSEIKKRLELGQDQLLAAQKNYESLLSQLKSESNKTATERGSIETRQKEIKSAIDETHQQLSQVAEGSLCLSLISPLLKKAQTQAKKEIEIKQAKLAEKLLKQREEKLITYLQALSLTEEQLSKVEHFLSLENQELYRQVNELTAFVLNATEEEIQQLKTLINSEVPIKVGQLKNLLDGLQNLKMREEMLKQELAIAPSSQDYDRLYQDVKIAEKEYIEARIAYEKLQTDYSKAQKNIERAKKELNEFSEKEIDQKAEENVLKSAQKVKQTLQMYKERLSAQKIHKLEREISECFRYLLHKSNLVHRVEVNHNNFALSLYDSEGEVVLKQRLSAGEKQLLAIAFLWSLARVSGRRLPVAIDTPLGRLDSSHRRNLIERYFPCASHQVILLSTDTEIGEKEVKSLRKQGAISREYLLEYKSNERQTVIHPGRYFW